MKFRIVTAAVVFFVCAAMSAVVGASPTGDGVRVDGALRAMFHQGQTGVVATLDSLLPNPDMYAVGALADLAGEVTVVGGKAYLSFPEGEDTSRTEVTTEAHAGVALLVSAEVPSWRSVRTERPIPFAELDEAIEQLAISAGIDLDQRVPFLVEGVFEDLEWHVIDGRRLSDGGGSHQQHLAAAVRNRLDRATATLVGFYSRSDEGVFTHMGARTHVHCVVAGPLSTGHVDQVTIPAGTTVKFPAR